MGIIIGVAILVALYFLFGWAAVLIGAIALVVVPLILFLLGFAVVTKFFKN